MVLYFCSLMYCGQTGLDGFETALLAQVTSRRWTWSGAQLVRKCCLIVARLGGAQWVLGSSICANF